MSSSVRRIGVDIVEIDRIDAAIKRFGRRFLYRILTPNELRDVGDPPKLPSVAARFAAKEAVSKALGTGIRGFSFRDIEVTRNTQGAPSIRLHGNAAEIAKAQGIDRVLISLSHARTVAIAMAVAEGAE